MNSMIEELYLLQGSKLPTNLPTATEMLKDSCFVSNDSLPCLYDLLDDFAANVVQLEEKNVNNTGFYRISTSRIFTGGSENSRTSTPSATARSTSTVCLSPR